MSRWLLVLLSVKWSNFNRRKTKNSNKLALDHGTRFTKIRHFQPRQRRRRGQLPVRISPFITRRVQFFWSKLVSIQLLGLLSPVLGNQPVPRPSSFINSTSVAWAMVEGNISAAPPALMVRRRATSNDPLQSLSKNGYVSFTIRQERVNEWCGAWVACAF